MENKILFWVGVIFILTVPIYIGIELKNIKVSAISAFCSGFIIFVSKMDTIAEITLGPLKAKMKETIQEANATIEQLKTVSVASAKATLTSLMAKNFWGGVSRKSQLDLHDQIIESFQSVGFSDQEINEADEMWRKGVGILYYNKIRPLIEGRTSPNTINMEASEEARQATQDFSNLLDFENWQAPTPDQITTFLNERGFLFSEIEEWIGDYQHYLDTGEIRRLELFANANN